MTFLAPRILDHGLFRLAKDTTRLTLTAAVATDYATATDSFGEYIPIISGPMTADVPPGRKMTVAAISDGIITRSGTVAAWALVDDNGEALLAAGPLLDSKAIVTGNVFTLPSFDIIALGVMDVPTLRKKLN